MRKTSFVTAVIAACAFAAPLVQGAGVYETFNQYVPPGSTSNWYYFVNDGPPYTGSYIGDADPGAGVAPAAYFYLNSGNLNPAVSNSVYFETNIISQGITPSGMRSAIAVIGSDTAGSGQGTPASTVASVGYYLYVDTVGNDDLADSYYISTMGLAASPGYLQNYDERSFNAAVWNRYDWNGTGWGGGAFEALGVTVPQAAIDETIFLGLQFDLNSFVPTDTDYLTIWVDDVFVPEPSALLLACFGAVGILARRGRRA